MSEVAADDAGEMRVNWRAVGMFALFVVLISGMVIAADVFSVRDRNPSAITATGSAPATRFVP